MLAGVLLGQRERERVVQLPHESEQRRVEEVERPRDFLRDRRLFELELASHPEQVELRAQLLAV